MNDIKNLANEAPASPRIRVRGYPLLARMADKGRAKLNGSLGEYHFNCPLDQMLFGFKGVEGEAVLRQLESGASNEQIAQWLDENGTPKTHEEVEAWADQIEAYKPFDDPEKRDWFVGECKQLGLDPANTTLMDYLDVDDRKSFGR